jgi:hypothetical protein
MNPFPQLEPDIERMVDGLIGHVWPGGHRSPPILDPEAVDFAWVNGRAVPLTTEGGEP